MRYAFRDDTLLLPARANLSSGLHRVETPLQTGAGQKQLGAGTWSMPRTHQNRVHWAICCSSSARSEASKQDIVGKAPSVSSHDTTGAVSCVWNANMRQGPSGLIALYLPSGSTPSGPYLLQLPCSCRQRFNRCAQAKPRRDLLWVPTNGRRPRFRYQHAGLG